jgi:hypothetical protein
MRNLRVLVILGAAAAVAVAGGCRTGAAHSGATTNPTASVQPSVQPSAQPSAPQPAAATPLGRGTPLFDMRTGATRDRYEYILDRHPELKKA